MPDGTTVLYRAVPQRLRFTAADKSVLQNFAQELTERIVSGKGFTCLVTNDRELRRLNKSFLGHDYATDVLSFPTDSPQAAGEIAISAERAAAQAEEFGHATLDEMRVLMLHGVLHLSGMDHERDGGEMARAERKWRASFSLPATLIARQER